MMPMVILRMSLRVAIRFVMEKGIIAVQVGLFTILRGSFVNGDSRFMMEEVFIASGAVLSMIQEDIIASGAPPFMIHKAI